MHIEEKGMEGTTVRDIVPTGRDGKRERGKWDGKESACTCIFGVGRRDAVRHPSINSVIESKTVRKGKGRNNIGRRSSQEGTREKSACTCLSIF